MRPAGSFSMGLNLSRSGMDESDDRLLFLARDGDSDAFAGIVERYRRLVLAYAVSLIGDQAVADDVAQVVFLRTWKSLDKVSDAMSLVGWLYATTRRCVSELGRQERRFQRSFSILEDGPAPVGEDPEDRRKRLLDALSELSDEMRLVLSLKYMEDFSCEMIARRMNRPLGTITSLLSRAYHEIRERMKRGDHEVL